MAKISRSPGAGSQIVERTPNQGSGRTNAARINQASGSAHAGRIRSAVENAPRMKEVDRRRAAENLWGILALTEQHGITKARVLHDGGTGS